MTGGNTGPEHPSDVVPQLAAMEPAGDRREHGLGSGWRLVVRPQWSPPLTGGNTRPRFVAAREHADRAAMEPAGDRREHGHAVGHGPVTAALPQWSPPVNGGSTVMPDVSAPVIDAAAMEPAVERREHRPARHDSRVPVPTLPQWSPPLNGGSTGRRPRADIGRYHGRNGARR